MQNTLIPIQISNLLKEQNFNKTQLSKAIHIIDHLLTLLERNDFIDEFHSLPYKYSLKVFGYRFYPVMDVLKKENIILCNESYCTGTETIKPYCKGYKVNTSFLDSEFDVVEYKYRKDCTDVIAPIMKSEIINDLNKLALNYNMATVETDMYCSSISIKSNEDINTPSFLLYVNNSKFYTSLEKAKEIANDENKEVLQYKDKFYIANRNELIESKAALIKYSYYRTISKISNKQFYAKRNATNYRIDTNITNMPSRLIQYLTVDDQKLKSVDCKNSQLTIFASILKNPGGFSEPSTNYFKQQSRTSSTDEFIQLCEKGLIYDEIATNLNIDRAEAKTLMFEIFFSKHTRSTPGKLFMKKHFPEVINLIDGYKKQYNDNAFAVLLQKIEAELFIDNIYTKLKENNVTVFTKHDSILYMQSNEDIVNSIIEETMKKYQIAATFSRD